jgi:peptidoglycan/xylan/chitin deacetylase (PgdA/CDA1 family)
VETSIRDARPLTQQPALLSEYHVNRPLLTVLTLHAVGRPAAGVDSYDYRNMFVDADALADLIAGLRSAGYCFLTLSEAVDGIRAGGTVPPKSIALTFDDGYASVSDAALPILRRYDIRAAAFIPTDYIGGTFAGNTRNGSGPALPTMTADQLRTLRRAGWDIGAHSASHAVFAGLDEAGARRELEGSRWTLERLLGERVRAFAFPYGEPGMAFTDSQAALAQRCGFDVILSTQPGFIDPRLQKSPIAASSFWPRIAVNHDSTAETLLDDLARVHRETHGWPSIERVGPTLGERVRRVVQRCVKTGIRRIALYGAGQHTARLLHSTPLWPLQVLAIVDDDPNLRGTQRFGLPVWTPADMNRLELDAVLISSDRFEERMYERLAPLATGGLDVLRLYAEAK